VEARKVPYDDPRREIFYSIFQMNALAAETAEDALKKIERMVETKRYERIRALIVRFKAAPVLLSVGAFWPLYDLMGQQLQDLEPDSAYLAMHILTAENKPAVVFTWLRGQQAA